MVPFIFLFALKKFRDFLRQNLVRVSIFLIGILIYGTFSEYFLESHVEGSGIQSFFDSLWFVVQTITTVGYGETAVVTFWGRVNAMVIMFAGIGVLGFFTAGIASEFIEYSLGRKLGERRTKMKNHVVLCNWNSIAEGIVHEILEEDGKIVLLALLDRNPVSTVEFVRGTSLHLADLEKANIGSAHSAVVLAEGMADGDLASAIDAKSILSVMNIKKLNPSVHLVVELLRSDSIENARLAGADEIVVWGDITAKILARGVLDPGTIDIVDTILTAKSGEEIFEDEIPSSLEGRRYEDLIQILIAKNALPIAVRGEKGLLVNPPREYIMDRESVVYIAQSRIQWEGET
jgi:voltage-gated potassium channel